MNDINPKLQTFVEWLATDPKDREPTTQKELAVKLGVSEPQLSNWKSELNSHTAKPSDVTALRDHIINEGKKGSNAQMAKLAWDITNPKDTETKEAEFTADDYINIATEVVKGLREEHSRSGGRCPVCDEHKALRNETRLVTEPEQSEGGEVATVAVSARPD